MNTITYGHKVAGVGIEPIPPYRPCHDPRQQHVESHPGNHWVLPKRFLDKQAPFFKIWIRFYILGYHKAMNVLQLGSWRSGRWCACANPLSFCYYWAEHEWSVRVTWRAKNVSLCVNICVCMLHIYISICVCICIHIHIHLYVYICFTFVQFSLQDWEVLPGLSSRIRQPGLHSCRKMNKNPPSDHSSFY